VFDVHFGEAFIVGFITAAVLSARFWPKMGEFFAVRLFGSTSAPPSPPANDRPSQSERTGG
jgi:hypothetical protein